jgi:uncharacterized protein (TIGR02466 family)
MAVDSWFPLAIYVEDLSEAADHRQDLLEAVLQLEKASGERRAFPDMAWTGDLHGVAQVHTDPRFAWVVSQVEAHTRLYLQDLGIDLNQVELYIQRSWPIVARWGQAVGTHNHPTAHVSVVYYVAVPSTDDLDGGELVFIDDARLNEVCPGLGSENTQVIREWNEFNQFQVAYTPVAGRILIFPAKQRHAVTMNETHDLRVSLSFDITITGVAGQSAGAYEFLTPSPSQWQRFGRATTQLQT